MRVAMMKTLAPLLIAALPTFSLWAAETKPPLTAEQREQRAEFNYKMFCRGCHGPAGEGEKAVPHMNGFVGHFLKFEAGRNYLVQVPGSANAALNDEQLTEALNWIVMNISGDSLPENFKPYTVEEVAKLRQEPLFEAFEFRKKLLNDMLQKGIIKELPAQPLK